MILSGKMPQLDMYRLSILHCKSSFIAGLDSQKQLDSRISYAVSKLLPGLGHVKLCFGRRRITLMINISPGIRPKPVKAADECRENLSDEDDDLCPVECVREFKTDEEFRKVIVKAKETGSLVVVDFFRTSCGSCKYIEQGFAKLCKKSGDQETPVIFLKHNVIDEYDEQSEVADRLRIKTVPLFHFYKDGVLLEAFPTRDKDKIAEAIRKYTSLELQDILS